MTGDRSEPLTYKAGKHEVEFTVDSRGWFHVDVLGKDFYGTELEAVVERAIAARRRSKVKLAIEVTILKNGCLRDAIITGVHAGSGNIMVRYEDGRKEAEQMGYRSDEILWRMSEADKEDHQALMTKGRDIADKVLAVEAEYRIVEELPEGSYQHGRRARSAVVEMVNKAVAEAEAAKAAEEAS